MTSMVERMARAIYDARNGPGATPFCWSGRMQKQAYISDTLAALREMRGPTEAMVAAAERAINNGGSLKAAYEAMIDAEIAAYKGKK